jgi:hypothetical protein
LAGYREFKMQYYDELPNVSYQGAGDSNEVELEVEGKVEKPARKDDKEIIFIGRMAGTIYLVVGQLVEYEYIPPKKAQNDKDFTRLKFEGTCVTVF